MCNQRERLIGYVYSEGDAEDRAEVQRHLDGCAECRAEIAGLRAVREDLLAWDVPAHESVWRPFVAAPVVPWWRQVPAWAMAAAAGVMLLFGAAGSMAVHAFAPDRTMARQSDVVAAPAGSVLTTADLSAVEQRMMARMHEEVGAVGAQLQQVSNRSQSVQALEGDHNVLAQELLRLRQENRNQLDVIKSIDARLELMRTTSAARSANLKLEIDNLRSLVVSQLQLNR
jgi:anti-sigma factor RsiW